MQMWGATDSVLEKAVGDLQRSFGGSGKNPKFHEKLARL